MFVGVGTFQVSAVLVGFDTVQVGGSELLEVVCDDNRDGGMVRDDSLQKNLTPDEKD